MAQLSDLGVKSGLFDLPLDERALPGNRACSGCGLTLAYRHALKALGQDTVVTVPASCLTVLHGMYPVASVAVNCVNAPFAATAAFASGLVAGLKATGREGITVVGFAGDGGTNDIGIQALSAAAERNTDFIYVCYDNEAYMNTGGQRSSATPLGATTSTTPILNKRQHPKDMPRIMAAHDVPYVATAASSYPMDLYDKFLKAKAKQGTRYIHISIPCPPGWLYPTRDTVKMGKLSVETGLIAGPHMQISLTMISQTGGHGDGWMPSGQHIRIFVPHPGVPGNIVDGVEEMRKKVRELVRMGADVIKVATSGGVLSPRDDPRHAHFTQEELNVLVETARGLGRWVMAHAQAYDGIKNAIRAGIRSIDHGIYLDDEAIGMMLERGTFLVPTLVAPLGVIRAAEAGAAIPEASVRKARDVVETHQDSFRRAVAAGVKVAMGTDSGVTPHGDNLEELALMEQGGMSPTDVLVATTRTAAECLDVAGDRGTIEPGKRADLVVVDGDPLVFTGIKDRVTAVFRDGVLAAGGI